MPKGFYWLIAAQFCSGLADNALLIVALAFLHEQGFEAWWAPMLKFAFTWAYVLLAPVVGTLADAVRKKALMGGMNAVKLLGALTLLLGAHPLLAFAVVGLGASAYAPAKYGLVTETVPVKRLVAANGWLEVTVVLSVLLGIALGGWLVSGSFDTRLLAGVGWLVPTRLAGAIEAVLAIYGLANLLNFGAPNRPARAQVKDISLTGLLSDFRTGNAKLWRDPLGGLSLAVTTVFWGASAVMQFAVLRWASDVLGMTLAHAAYLQATVALGVVAGAAAVAHRIPLQRAAGMLPLGIVLGFLVLAAAWVQHWTWALPALFLAGVAGGALVVPMNALLQYRGHRLLSPGRSIAVQGFNENLSILVMLGVYALLLACELPIVPLMVGFGLLLSTGMLILWRWTRTSIPRTGPLR